MKRKDGDICSVVIYQSCSFAILRYFHNFYCIFVHRIAIVMIIICFIFLDIGPQNSPELEPRSSDDIIGYSFLNRRCDDKNSLLLSSI